MNFFCRNVKSRWLRRLLAMLVCIPLLLAKPGGMDAKTLQDSATGPKIVVLNYHKIDYVNISLSITPENFDAQMAYLKRNNYHSITPDELYNSIVGNGSLPENPVLITFDDGYEDNYRYAYPILKKYDFKATIFVVTSFLDHYPNYLTWEQAKEMEANGISIESHTATHKSMTELDDEQIRDELVKSKKTIEEKLGKPSSYIAYPTGTYNLHIAQLMKEAGYKAAFTIKYGNVDKASNVYALERVPVFHTENTHKSFLERIQYLPIFERLGWIKN